MLFLLSLDEEVARPIVKELGAEELRKLRTVAATMREVPTGALQETFREFLERSDKAVAVPRGGLPYLRRLSAGALGEERTREVFQDGASSPFTRLEDAPPDAVAALLALESPRLAAAVLAKLGPTAAASVLAAMPEERQCLVVQHVSRLTELPEGMLEDVATALASELPAGESSAQLPVDGIAVAAAMLNASGPLATTLLENMDITDASLAGQIRQAMFTFDDLARLDARAMREILREVPTERLVVALKGASEAVSEVLFSGLSARAAELIRDDLELLGRVKKQDIEAARREIVEVALRLEAQGRVDLGRDGE